MPASALMNVMIGAARKAGRSLARDFGEVEQLQVSLKGPANFVSAADTRAEEILFAELSRARPGYSFLMEERGVVKGNDANHRWLIDPLDGTTNFLHGIPIFAVSIALERDGDLAPEFDPATAADLLWSLLTVPNWENLTQRRDWSQAHYAQTMKTAAHRLFLA